VTRSVGTGEVGIEWAYGRIPMLDDTGEVITVGERVHEFKIGF